MGDHNVQDIYLAGGIKATIVLRRRPSKHDSVIQLAYQYTVCILKKDVQYIQHPCSYV